MCHLGSRMEGGGYPHTHPGSVSIFMSDVAKVRTYNGNLSTEVVFDFALLDGIWGVFVDDRGEL